MKTLEEVKEHLSEVGYNRQAMMQIEAFLLGGGMITPNEELDFMKGKGDFEDFMEWYVYDDEEELVEEEYEKGDYIHVQDDMNVLCVSDVINGKFVGTNGTMVHQYELTNESRFCNDEEQEAIEVKLKDNGITYCYECEELEPIVEVKEENDIPSECLDCMEAQCHEAIENIVANLHSKEISGLERMMVIDSLKALIILGKAYE